MSTSPVLSIVRASGWCVACDFRFVDEVVARFPCDAIPGGFGHLELRHLEEPLYADLAPAGAARAVRRGDVSWSESRR